MKFSLHSEDGEETASNNFCPNFSNWCIF